MDAPILPKATLFNVRNALLTLVASPDRAVLTLAIGMLFISKEFLRPGRVVPGVVGAVLAAISLWALAGYGLTAKGCAAAVVGLLLLVLQGFRFGWLLAAVATGALVLGTKWLVARPPVSWKAAAAMIPVSLILAFLIQTAVRARRNKTQFTQDRRVLGSGR